MRYKKECSQNLRVLPSFITFGRELIKDIQDEKGDKAQGYHTFAVTQGQTKTKGGCWYYDYNRRGSDNLGGHTITECIVLDIQRCDYDTSNGIYTV